MQGKLTEEFRHDAAHLLNTRSGCISVVRGVISARNVYNRKIVKHILMLTNFNRHKPAVALVNANFVQLV